jgi:hypothetical protein
MAARWTVCAVAVALGFGCSRKPPGDAPSGAIDAAVARPGPAAPEVPAAAPIGETPPVFSLPIAATRAAGETIVAGYVAAEGVVRAMALRDRRVMWTVDAVHGVTWGPDAELRIEPAGDGVAVSWRTGRGGSGAVPGVLAAIGAHGEQKGVVDGVGGSVCATATGAVWIGGERHGPTRVHARPWAEGADAAVRDVASVAADRAASLTCAAHGAFVMGDGDDDITAAWLVPGEGAAGAPVVVLRDAEFRDDERDHYAFSVGDDLVFVRVGESGEVAVRRVRPDTGPGPWRRWKHAIGSEDDVVEVDGDESGTVLVVAVQSGSPCASTGAPADRLQAVRLDSADHESVTEIAPAECDRTPGPVWLGTAPEAGPVVLWGQAPATPKAAAAPVTGVAFRTVGAGPARSGELRLDAVEVVRAGCDAEGCFAAALRRAQTQSSDAMEPLAIEVVRLL